MQAQHYTLALAIAWIFTLTALPYLFAKARKRAYEKGLTSGLETRDAMAWKRIQELESDIEERAIQREAEQRHHQKTKAALRGTINDLEARIKAYTGLAVTAADHRLMIQAAETLSLAHRTWAVMKSSEAWRDRATAESEGLRKLAGLVHAKVRRTATANKTEDAA